MGHYKIIVIVILIGFIFGCEPESPQDYYTKSRLINLQHLTMFNRNEQQLLLESNLLISHVLNFENELTIDTKFQYLKSAYVRIRYVVLENKSIFTKSELSTIEFIDIALQNNQKLVFNNAILKLIRMVR